MEQSNYMDPLAKLFGSPARLKLLRLFIFNDDVQLTLAEAATRTRVPKDTARKEINALVMAGVLKKKTGKAPLLFSANKKFAYFDPLSIFLRDTTSVSDGGIVSALKKAGSLRLVVLTGLFTNVLESKIDILVVGDKLEDRPLESAIHMLEAELGRELRYAAFTTMDFRYRVGVYDRLIRDVMDYPHRAILDKIGI